MPIPGLNRAVVQAINVGRSISDDVRAVYITDDPDAASRAPRPTSSARSRASRWSSSSRPYRALVGPLLAYLDVLDSAWPPDKDDADHVRGHPRVRRPQLVGADPLQPVGQAAADGPARAPAHGRRRRPLPARGPGAVRVAASGADAAPDQDGLPDAIAARRGSTRPDVASVPVVS